MWKHFAEEDDFDDDGRDTEEEECDEGPGGDVKEEDESDNASDQSWNASDPSWVLSLFKKAVDDISLDIALSSGRKSDFSQELNKCGFVRGDVVRVQGNIPETGVVVGHTNHFVWVLLTSYHGCGSTGAHVVKRCNKKLQKIIMHSEVKEHQVDRKSDGIEKRHHVVAKLDKIVNNLPVSYRRVSNEKGYAFGDKVKILWDKTWTNYYAGHGKASLFEGKVGYVIGHTKCYVHVMLPPLSKDAPILKKRLHNVRRIDN